MLEILCEDVNPEAAINVDKIIRVVGVITLHKNMVYCYQQRNVDDSGIEAAIKTHNLLKHVNEFEGVKAGEYYLMHIRHEMIRILFILI